MGPGFSVLSEKPGFFLNSIEAGWKIWDKGILPKLIY